jgi:SAM-dependent methyltransferase
MGENLEETLNAHAFWHFRYQQQAEWTREIRGYLFSQAGVLPDEHVLDVGCGSGAVIEALSADGFTRISGVDNHFPILASKQSQSDIACADGKALPFSRGQFDHALCHFTLLWAQDPQKMICEMRRVTRRGGWVFALAEPDYGGRISYPAELEQLATLQTEALQKQGANTSMGRELMGLMSACGMKEVSSGIIGAEMRGDAAHALRGDLRVLRKDLANSHTPEEIARILAEAETAASAPGAMWYVPVCYACGQVA